MFYSISESIWKRLKNNNTMRCKDFMYLQNIIECVYNIDQWFRDIIVTKMASSYLHTSSNDIICKSYVNLSRVPSNPKVLRIWWMIRLDIKQINKHWIMCWCQRSFGWIIINLFKLYSIHLYCCNSNYNNNG